MTIPLSTELSCATCGIKISRITLPDGTESYAHPGSDGHAVIPVARPEIIRVCDFCLRPHPSWVIPLREHATTTQKQGIFLVTSVDTDGLWAACDACRRLVEGGHSAELRWRAYRGASAVRRMAGQDPAARHRYPAGRLLERRPRSGCQCGS